jgi:hypothetical protein
MYMYTAPISESCPFNNFFALIHHDVSSFLKNDRSKERGGLKGLPLKRLIKDDIIMRSKPHILMFRGV